MGEDEKKKKVMHVYVFVFRDVRGKFRDVPVRCFADEVSNTIVSQLVKHLQKAFRRLGKNYGISEIKYMRTEVPKNGKPEEE